MRSSGIVPFVLSASIAWIASCGGGGAVCVPGGSVACSGPGGCAGFQVCASDGSMFLACDCGSAADAGDVDAGAMDAAVTSDAGHDGGASFDASSPDAASEPDGATIADAGVDAGEAFDAGEAIDATPQPDAGPLDAGPMCSPACDATTRCCGSTCVSRTGVAMGLDGRDDPSFNHCNNCNAACDPALASACSLPPGGFMPRCMCGTADACTGPATCALAGDRFACRCGSITCPAGRVCALTDGVPSCVDLYTDPNHCGGVDRACLPGRTCRSGRCTCGTGFFGLPCDDAARSCCGTECVDTQTNALHCGGCDMACRSGEACVAGLCRCEADGTRCGLSSPTSLGQTCCSGTCVDNTDASCPCTMSCPEIFGPTSTCIARSGGEVFCTRP